MLINLYLLCIHLEVSVQIFDKLKVYLACYSNVICFANCEAPSNIENSQSIERLFRKAIVLNIPNNTERVKFLKEFTKNLEWMYGMV